MFADPSVVTINSVAKNLVRVNQDKYSSEYALRSATDEYLLNIRNTFSVPKGSSVRIDRHNVEIIHTVFATSTTPKFVRRTYVVIENQEGDTLTDPRNVALGLFAFLSSAKIDQLMNRES